MPHCHYHWANDDGAFLQVKGEVAVEIEAAGEPAALGHVQLRAALVGEGAVIEDGVREGHRVEGLFVPDGAELGDDDAVQSLPLGSNEIGRFSV